MEVRNSLHGKKIKSQLWSQGKVLFRLQILPSSSCPFPKLNQDLPSSFNSNTWLSLAPTAALEQGLRHQLDATLLK